MTELVAIAILIASGRATRYGPSVMDAVVANRIEWGQVDPDIKHKGYVALLDCKHIGRLVWLQHGLVIDGPYMVADCAASHDRDRLKALGWAVDLSWELAQEWGVVNDVGRDFQVWDSDPIVLLMCISETRATWTGPSPGFFFCFFDMAHHFTNAPTAAAITEPIATRIPSAPVVAFCRSSRRA